MAEEEETFLFLPQPYKSHNKGPHPLLLHLKTGFSTDWSIIRTGSPLVRMLPQSILVRERGQEINQTAIQTSQPRSEPTQMGVTENTL